MGQIFFFRTHRASTRASFRGASRIEIDVESERNHIPMTDESPTGLSDSGLSPDFFFIPLPSHCLRFLLVRSFLASGSDEALKLKTLEMGHSDTTSPRSRFSVGDVS